MSAPLVPSDLLLLALPGDPQPPVNGRIFYVLATQDEATDEKRSAIWSVRSGEAATRFTTGHRDRSPRVSPDGSTLAFIGERGDGIRIYVLPLGGGEPYAVGPAYDRIDGLTWSPDSKTLAYAATTPLEPETARIALDERSGARHIRALPFKSDDDGLLDGRRRHLFTLAVEGGEPVRLTHGDFDVYDPAWSPQGDRIAFSAHIDIPESRFFEDIFTIDATGGAPVRLTRSRGPAGYASFSNDGRFIAFIGHENSEDAGGRFNMELLIVPVEGGETRSVSAPVDRPVMDFVGCDTRGVGAIQAPYWSSDDAEIFVPLSTEGTCAIAAFATDGSTHRLIASGERDIFAFVRGLDGTIVYAFSTPLVPAELGIIAPVGADLVLTESNPWLAERSLRAPRRVRPVASDATVLDLWILDPDERENAPYVLQVHGGPHTAYGFAFMLEFQILAAHGIGVAYGNPRGSQTYGVGYADAIVGDWGGIDASDVLTLLDGLLANAPAADPKRIGIAGGSYGGFMVTWLLGHCKRFAAGVSMRAVNDFVSEVGATDLGWFLERELEAPWADGGRKLFEMSPMRAAHEIDVPLLVEHSERDYRCAIDQGEQLFTLLRRLGRTQTEFVRFTGDGHGLSRGGKPRNRILRLRSIVHWFVRHLRPNGIEPVADAAGSLFVPLPTETGAA